MASLSNFSIFNTQPHKTLVTIIRIALAGLFFGLVTTILLTNFSPFGAQIYYDLSNTKYLSKLSPPSKVQTETFQGETVFKQIDDIIYFTSTMPQKFENGKIRITYQNPNPDQEIHLGYQDEIYWHYDTKLFDSSLLNKMIWSSIGTNPTIFQKQPTFSSYEDFLKNPPGDKVIGTYNFDRNILKGTIADYRPSDQLTLINTPMRGKVVFYVYVKDERYKMWVAKQDLNWYEDPDPVNIKIIKETDEVYAATIGDDGVIDTSQKVLPAQEVYIENPGPELPEPGVYKIIIDGGGDTVITSIKTNLTKIVFEGPLNLVSNAQVFPKIVKETTPNKLFSNAFVLSAQTYHPQATQSARIGNNVLDIKEVKQEVATHSSGLLEEVEFPKSDVVVNGLLGYFSFTKEQFFEPSPYRLIAVNKSSDLEAVDFLITNYQKPKVQNGWSVAEVSFDITDAYYKNGKLSWLIKAPKLKENGGHIIIKNIEVEFTKKPLIRW